MHLAFVVHAEGSLIPYQTLSGDIDDQEWKALLRYAARVRELAFHPYWDPLVPYHIDPTVFDIFFKRTAGQPLFPNLKLLAWQRAPDVPASVSHDRLLTLLTPPTLSVVIFWHPRDEVPFPGDKHLYRKFLDGDPRDVEVITSRAPNVQHILSELTLGPEDFRTLPFCRHLRSLTVTVRHIDASFFASIFCLQELERLRVTLHTAQCTGSSPDRLNPIDTHEPLEGLSALKAFELLNTDASNAAQTLALLPLHSPLSTVKMELFRSRLDCGPLGDSPVISALAPLSGYATTLRQIHLDVDYRLDQTQVDTLLDFERISAPLLALPRIEEASLSTIGRRISLSNWDVARIASSWPNLTRFRIPQASKSYGTSSPPAASPSLLSVVALAQRCPKLEALVLPVAPISEPELGALEELAGAAALQTTLVRFCPLLSYVAWTALECPDVPWLARALLRIFPSLEDEETLGRMREHREVARFWAPSVEMTLGTAELLSEIRNLQAKGETADRETTVRVCAALLRL